MLEDSSGVTSNVSQMTLNGDLVGQLNTVPRHVSALLKK